MHAPPSPTSLTAASSYSFDTAGDRSGGEPRLPEVHLFHQSGAGHLQKDFVNPKIRSNGEPSRFRIVPLDKATGKPLRVVEAHVETRSTYVNHLKSLSSKGVKVAIQAVESGQYLSCRSEFRVTKSALCEYRSKLGKYSHFAIEHCPEKGSFSFRSHNGLLLHYSKVFWTAVFKSESTREASWAILPLGLRASGGEQILFVGVLDAITRDFTACRTAEGVELINWRAEEQRLHALFELLGPGECTIFQHPITNNQWCVMRSKGDTNLNIIISTEDYPHFFATECVEDLACIERRYHSDNPKLDADLQKRKLNKEEVLGKELAAMMYDYDDQYASSLIAGQRAEVERLTQEMRENIAKLQENIECAEELLETSDELLEMAKEFKKKTSKLPKGRRLAMILAITGTGAGAIVGWLIGGPFGAVVASSQVVEIAAGAGLGLLSGGLASLSCTTFWQRKFVSVGPKSQRLLCVADY